MDDKELAASIEKRDAFEASIVLEYDNEADRNAARAALAESEGIDWKTGYPADYVPPDPEDKPHDGSADALSQDAQVGAQKTEPGETEPGETEPGADAAAKAAEEAEAAKTAAEADEAAKKAASETDLAAEIKARDERIAELEGTIAKASLDSEIRKEVSEKVQEKLTENERLNKADQERVAKFAEEYGDDAAEALRAQAEETRKLRAAEVAQFQQAEIDRARSERAQEVDAQIDLQRDINANEDLRRWREDARANYLGDESKSPDNYDLAVSIDAALRESAEWKDKPRRERFEEAVRMVKASTGASSPGSPGAKDAETKPAAGKTNEEIAAEIAKKAAAGSTDDGLPGSLSDLPGGAAGEQSELAKFDKMSMAEMSDAGYSVEKMDSIFEQHLVEADEAQAGAM